MKKFLFTLAAMLMAVAAFADNKFFIEDFEVTQEQLGTELTLNLMLQNDVAFNAYEIHFAVEGDLTLNSAKTVKAAFKLPYLDEDGEEDEADVSANAMGNVTDGLMGFSAVSGYWDPDGDGEFETYGAVKWMPNEEAIKFYTIKVTPAATFAGGKIIVTGSLSSGNDTRDIPIAKPAVEFESVCNITVEGGTVEPEVTEKPVITTEEVENGVKVVATGNGHICLYVEDILVAEGEGTAEYVIESTELEEEYGVSATAQEEGKEVSEYALATVYVPGTTVEPEVTEAPVVTYEVTDDAVIITATGAGEVVLYVNDEAVENPYTIARPEAGEEDITIFVYATAQEEGKEMGTSDVEPIVVEAQEGGEVPPVDPHAEGYWLVTYDMDGNEIWTELTESNGDYNVILRCSYGVYGTFDYYGGETRPDIVYYIVVDGVRYGAAVDGTLTVLGEALQNPLTEGENNYVLEEGLGKVYNMGVAIDEMTGDMYVYAAVAGFTEIDEMNAGKAVAGVRYFNMAGQEMQEANGMTIVVTTYTDGTTSAVKVMK